jgi:hypothetical protein
LNIKSSEINSKLNTKYTRKSTTPVTYTKTIKNENDKVVKKIYYCKSEKIKPMLLNKFEDNLTDCTDLLQKKKE